jgi:hypothetical protein
MSNLVPDIKFGNRLRVFENRVLKRTVGRDNWRLERTA